jgi:hypothetical protein
MTREENHRAGSAVHADQAKGAVDVHQRHEHQAAPSDPQKWTQRFEIGRVGVDGVAPNFRILDSEEDLQVADHVRENESHEQKAGNRHHMFSADRGF